MSETDKLRALLDKRGVEHKCGTGPANGLTTTIWEGRHGRRCFAFEDVKEGGLRLQSNVTPEQAIAATLGLDRDEAYDAGFANGMKAVLQQLDGLIAEGARIDDVQAWIDGQWEGDGE